MTKVYGKMENAWISHIARSPEVQQIIKQEATVYKAVLERKLQLRYPKYNSYHFGRTDLSGSWGTTAVIWPVSKPARADKNLDVFPTTAGQLGLKEVGGN